MSEVCQLLGCSNENLSGALTQRTIEVKREWVKTDFTEAGVSFAIKELHYKIPFPQNNVANFIISLGKHGAHWNPFSKSWENIIPFMHASMGTQGSHRLEKYMNIQDCLEKSWKIKLALNST